MTPKEFLSNVPDLKTSALLLSMGPGIAVATDAQQDEINKVTEKTITTTRADSSNSLLSNSTTPLFAQESVQRTLESDDFVEIQVESGGSVVTLNNAKNKFQVPTLLSGSYYTLIDPETGDLSISSVRGNNAYADFKWNLAHDGYNLFEYDTVSESYQKVAGLNWDDAVKVGDMYYGVRDEKLEYYDPSTGVRDTLATIPYKAGDLKKIEPDSSGNLYLYSLKMLSTFDRNHGLWKYDLSTEEFKELVFENNDILDRSGIAGLAIVGNDVYVCNPYAKFKDDVLDPNNIEDAKTFIMKYADTTEQFTAWKEIHYSETGNDVAVDFVGFVTDDGEVRFALQFSQWQKTMILKESPAPEILNSIPNQTLIEDFEAFDIALDTLADDANDDYSYAVSSFPSDLINANIEGDTLKLSPVENGFGSGEVTLVVRNQDGRETPVTFSVEITPVNDAPTYPIPIEDATYEEDGIGSEIIPLNNHFEDPDGDALTYGLSYETTNPNLIVSASINEDTGELEIVYAPNESGEVTFTILALDGTTSTEISFKRTITAVNDAPVITSASSITTKEDEPFVYTIEGSDIENDALTMNASGLPSWLSFDGTNQITGTPTNDEVGEHTFTVAVSDGLLTTTQEVKVTVENVNDAPVITSASSETTKEDQPYTYTIEGSDDDNDALSFKVDNLPSWLTFDGTNQISGRPSNDEVGEHTFMISANDGTVTTEQEVKVTVENVNDAPEISPIADQTILEGETLSDVSFTVTDVDNAITTDNISIASSNESVLQASQVTVTKTNEGFSLDIPTVKGKNGEVEITVTASDGELTGSTAFTLTIDEQIVMSADDHKAFSVYPNPISDYLQINLSDSSIGHVRIFSTTGQLMINEEVNATKSVNVSTLRPGTYLVQVATEEGTIYQERIFKN